MSRWAGAPDGCRTLIRTTASNHRLMTDKWSLSSAVNPKLINLTIRFTRGSADVESSTTNGARYLTIEVSTLERDSAATKHIGAAALVVQVGVCSTGLDLESQTDQRVSAGTVASPLASCK